MKLITKEKIKLNKFLDWIFYMISYTLAFITITSLFKSIHIDSKHLIIWSITIVLVTYILNKTIKPILVTLTIPITGITLGLFYPCINVFMLKLTDWILGSHFDIKNIYVALFLAILLSIVNFIIEKLIDKVKYHG